MRQDYLETTVDKFIFRVKVGCLYSETGVWVDMNETSSAVRLRLSDYTQQSSGDVAFVSLPVLGDEDTQAAVRDAQVITLDGCKLACATVNVAQAGGAAAREFTVLDCSSGGGARRRLPCLVCLNAKSVSWPAPARRWPKAL
jgi:hypothetical protein